MKVFPPTCEARSTWFGCGWRGVGDGAPLDDMEVLYASTGVAFPRRNSRRRSWTLVNDCGARLCLPPPPPSPFPHTTILVPIPSLLTEEYFLVRPARPYPAFPPWNLTSYQNMDTSSLSLISHSSRNSMSSEYYVTRVRKFHKTKKIDILLSRGLFDDQCQNINMFLFYTKLVRYPE